jgi:hypothetical protein
MMRAGYWVAVVLAALVARAEGALPATRPTTRPTTRLTLRSTTKPATQNVPAKPTAHTIKEIEGWKVHVDDRLLSGVDKELGERALRLLGEHLKRVESVVPAEKLQRMKEVPIWLDRTHGALKSAQYHPSRAWLWGNGYDQALARCVHIPDAAGFVSPRLQHDQPWMVLHELAHAYHDQVLGFEEPRIKAAWKKFVESGKYESVKHISGEMVRHYGLTDQKEFFAEMSEAYFGMNDFFPFNREELGREEPELLKLMEEIWGKVVEK